MLKRQAKEIEELRKMLAGTGWVDGVYVRMGSLSVLREGVRVTDAAAQGSSLNRHLLLPPHQKS